MTRTHTHTPLQSYMSASTGPRRPPFSQVTNSPGENESVCCTTQYLRESSLVPERGQQVYRLWTLVIFTNTERIFVSTDKGGPKKRKPQAIGPAVEARVVRKATQHALQHFFPEGDMDAMQKHVLKSRVHAHTHVNTHVHTHAHTHTHIHTHTHTHTHTQKHTPEHLEEYEQEDLDLKKAVQRSMDDLAHMRNQQKLVARARVCI